MTDNPNPDPAPVPTPPNPGDPRPVEPGTPLLDTPPASPKTSGLPSSGETGG